MSETENKTAGNGEKKEEQKLPQSPPTQSDLQALKAKHEKELTEVTARWGEATQKSEGHYNSLLQEQAAKEKLVAELEGFKKEVVQLKVDKATREQLEKSLKEANAQLLDVSAKRLAQVHGIPVEKLTGKTLAELNSIEEALKLVGRDARKYDVAGPGGEAGAGSLSARQMIKAGFDERRDASK